MLVVNKRLAIPLREFTFTFVRSSGPGGQNVNKVNTKAVLRWNVVASPALPVGVGERFREKFRRPNYDRRRSGADQPTVSRSRAQRGPTVSKSFAPCWTKSLSRPRNASQRSEVGARMNGDSKRKQRRLRRQRPTQAGPSRRLAAGQFSLESHRNRFRQGDIVRQIKTGYLIVIRHSANLGGFRGDKIGLFSTHHDRIMRDLATILARFSLSRGTAMMLKSILILCNTLAKWW